ncbi:MAG: protein syrA [Sinorhizobium meliloti]|nr:protein syrA [Sinorhizobium meliloti]
MPFRTFPCIFCLLLCTNALAIYAVSHPFRSLLVVILAYSLLLQIAYIGSVFLLVCLIALSKGLTNFRLVIGAQSRTSAEKEGLADCHSSSPAGMGQGRRRTA